MTIKQNLDNQTAFVIGKNYLIRTATYFNVGRLTAIYPMELVLEEGAWIPDTGRFSDAFIEGEFAEVEPVDAPIIVQRYSIIDSFEWNHPLPRKQK